MTDSQNKPAWRPSVEPGTIPSLEEIIGQVVGAGSMCWSNPADAGTFDSEKAKWATDGAIETIRKFYVERDLYADPILPDDVLNRWVSCSRAEAIRQCEANHATVIEYARTIDNLQGQVRALRAEIAGTDIVNPWASAADAPSEGEGASDVAAQWDGARDDDKIHVIRALLDGTTAFGSDMARFKRQLELIVNA